MTELKGADAGEMYGDLTTGASGGEPSDVCETCLVDGNNRPAVGWCETCDERLCDDCYKTHCRPKRMRDHQLCSIADMKIGKQRKKVANRCEKHGGELLKYFCEDHSEPACSQCFVYKHRLCSKVICISEVKTSEGDELKDLVNLLSDIGTRLKVDEEIADRNVTLTVRQHDTAIADIEEAGKRLKTLIDKLVKNQIAKIQKIQDDYSRNMADIEETIKDVATKLQSCRELLAAEKEDNNQLFLTMKHLHREANLLKSELQESEKKATVSEYEFVLNPELASVLEKVTVLGTLTDKYILNMEKATDEVKEEMGLELRRFERMNTHGLWHQKSPDVIYVTIDHAIRLLNVLIFPCLWGDTEVELTVSDDRRNLVKCTSIHKNTIRHIIGVEVDTISGSHGITLQAGHRYLIRVNIKGSPTRYGVDGQANISVAGVKFSFTPDTQGMTPASMFATLFTGYEPKRMGTTVSEGQIAGFRFTRL